MKHKPRNYAALFDLYARNTPDSTSSRMQKIGKIGFTISFAGAMVAYFLGRTRWENSFWDKAALGLFGIGFLAGMTMFLAVGIYYIGQEKGKKNFLSSALHVLKNTLVYLFLPVALLTAALVVWAIMTEQPAFR